LPPANNIHQLRDKIHPDIATFLQVIVLYFATFYYEMLPRARGLSTLDFEEIMRRYRAALREAQVDVIARSPSIREDDEAISTCSLV